MTRSISALSASKSPPAMIATVPSETAKTVGKRRSAAALSWRSQPIRVPPMTSGRKRSAR